MATIEKRTSKDGLPVYRVKVRRKGTPAQTATFQRLTDAKKWASLTEGAAIEGRHFPTSEAKRHTLAELIDRYSATILPHKRPKTVVNQQHQLAWWREQLGHLRLAEMTSRTIADCRDALAEHRAPATVRRYLAVLEHAFTVAVREWQWLEDNPLRRVSKPKEPRGRIRFLDDEERQRLLVSCQHSQCPYLALVVRLALATGARKGELLSLQWTDVNLAQGRLTFHDTKNGQRRGVPVTGVALDLLRQHAKVRRLDTSLVFPRADGLLPLDIRSAWETAVKHAGLEDFRFHDLRHSAASYLAMSGASLAEIAEILGHKTLAMVQRYSHLSESHVSQVAERMTSRFLGVDA